jgi:hypothetical protein
MAWSYVYILRRDNTYATRVRRDLGQILDDLKYIEYTGVDLIRVFGVPDSILEGALTMANQFAQDCNNGKKLKITDLEKRIRLTQRMVEIMPHILN